ncbi:unnamed protein product [Effrenium voratum]|nr:unnamed protein product [Effrenium voratum]
MKITCQGQLNSADVKNRKSHTAFRTSKQAWLSNAMSPLIAELDERTARLTRIPAENNEPAQLLRYDEGAYYHSHMDWTELDFYPDQRHIWASSHLGHFDRIATVFWYLNDVAVGGETVFPKHGQPICSPESKGGPKVRTCLGATDPDMASCEGFKVRPKRGSVVLWYNFLASGRGDRNALHAGCPVGTNLTKWSANKWVRNKALGSPSQWIEGHPALQRFGWHGEDAEVGSCHISFKNDFEKQVALLWLSGSGSRELATIRRGGRLSQASYQGHRFQVKSEEQLSNEVTCAPPGADFVALQMQEYFEALLRYIPFVDQCEALREFLCSVDVSNMSYDALLDLEQALGRGGPELQVDPALVAALPKRQAFASHLGCCVICQETMEKDEDVRVLPCGHEYHFECISQWIKQCNTCCVCHSMAVAQPDCEDLGST